MTQYNSIEDAILALTQKFSIDIFENTPRFIAILSDYAPNHTSEQLLPEQMEWPRLSPASSGRIVTPP